MQAFKLYIRLTIEHALPTILLYLGIFTALIAITSIGNSDKATDSFDSKNVKTAILNYDHSENLSKELESFINKNTRNVIIKDDDDSLKDALFFGKAEFILIIPNGFSEAFFSQSPIQLEHLQIPNSSSAGAVHLLINNYLNTVQMYHKGTGNINYEQINLDMSQSVETEIISSISDKDNNYVDQFFLIFLAYPLMSCLFFSLPIVNIIMNKDEIKRRNLCAPISYTKYSLQIFLGNILLTIIILGFFVLLGVITGGLNLTYINHQLVLLNALFLSFAILAISFFISLLATETIINPLAVTISLAFSFLGGVFVPKSLLGESVLKFSVINPAYWYVKGVETIMSISDFSYNSMKTLYSSFLIQILFVFTFLSMSLLVLKLKRQAE
ncbi:MAG TPA: ABC transporter permease [Clostridiales bacterium]|nr:ABC transporter permease [Clostridiales bacterium]